MVELLSFLVRLNIKQIAGMMALECLALRRPIMMRRVVQSWALAGLIRIVIKITIRRLRLQTRTMKMPMGSILEMRGQMALVVVQTALLFSF